MSHYQFLKGDRITTRRQVGAIAAGTPGVIERVYPTAGNVYKVAFDPRSSEVLLGDDLAPVDGTPQRVGSAVLHISVNRTSTTGR